MRVEFLLPGCSIIRRATPPGARAFIINAGIVITTPRVDLGYAAPDGQDLIERPGETNGLGRGEYDLVRRQEVE